MPQYIRATSLRRWAKSFVEMLEWFVEIAGLLQRSNGGGCLSEGSKERKQSHNKPPLWSFCCSDAARLNPTCVRCFTDGACQVALSTAKLWSRLYLGVFRGFLNLIIVIILTLWIIARSKKRVVVSRKGVNTQLLKPTAFIFTPSVFVCNPTEMTVFASPHNTKVL